MASQTNYGVDNQALSVELPEITLRTENLVNKNFNVEELGLPGADNYLEVESASIIATGQRQTGLRTVFSKWRGVAGLFLGLLVTLALFSLVPFLMLQSGHTTSMQDETEDTGTQVTQWIWVTMGCGACLFLVVLVMVKRRCED